MPLYTRSLADINLVLVPVRCAEPGSSLQDCTNLNGHKEVGKTCGNKRKIRRCPHPVTLQLLGSLSSAEEMPGTVPTALCAKCKTGHLLNGNQERPEWRMGPIACSRMFPGAECEGSSSTCINSPERVNLGGKNNKEKEGRREDWCWWWRCTNNAVLFAGAGEGAVLRSRRTFSPFGHTEGPWGGCREGGLSVSFVILYFWEIDLKYMTKMVMIIKRVWWLLGLMPFYIFLVCEIFCLED